MYSLYLIFTEKISKTALSAKNDKRIQSVDSKERYTWNKQDDNT